MVSSEPETSIHRDVFRFYQDKRLLLKLKDIYRNTNQRYNDHINLTQDGKLTIYAKPGPCYNYRFVTKHLGSHSMRETGFVEGTVAGSRCLLYIDSSSVYPFMAHEVAEKLGVLYQIETYTYEKLPYGGEIVRLGQLNLKFKIGCTSVLSKQDMKIYICKARVLPMDFKWRPKADLVLDCCTMFRNGLHVTYERPCTLANSLNVHGWFRKFHRRVVQSFLYTVTAYFTSDHKYEPIRILLDTDSEVCKVSEAFLCDRLDLPSGRSISEIQLNVGGSQNVEMENLQVVKDNRFDLMLGRSVLTKYACKIDYGRGYLYFAIPRNGVQSLFSPYCFLPMKKLYVKDGKI